MTDMVFAAVFGSESRGTTPEARARTSDMTFVRSQHQISRWAEGATGRILDAEEALKLVGWEVLQDLADHHATPFGRQESDAHRAIFMQIQNLGIDEQKKVFDAANLSETEIDSLKVGRQVPYLKLERLETIIFERAVL